MELSDQKVTCDHRDKAGFLDIVGFLDIASGRMQYVCARCRADWDETWEAYVPSGAAIPANLRKPKWWQRALWRLLK